MSISPNSTSDLPFTFSKESVHFLETYINNASPSGFEVGGQQLWIDYLKPFIDEYFTDNYGSAVGVINKEAKYKVAIEAHADEISWLVNYITNDGLIYVVPNGRCDHQIAVSKKVNIYTTKGIVKGVFGWQAIHTREKDENPSLENIFVDCGCTDKEEVVKLGVCAGNAITFEEDFFILNNKYFVGRGLDNRIGGFMLAEVARLLKENNKKLPFGLYIINSVQEEVGLNGAKMIAQKIKPDAAIITDVTHDTQAPNVKKNLFGDIACGKGPVVTYAPAVQRNLQKLILETADMCNIVIQHKAKGISTGTDTDAFAYSGEGIVSALISLPLKYMHTTVEDDSPGRY